MYKELKVTTVMSQLLGLGAMLGVQRQGALALSNLSIQGALDAFRVGRDRTVTLMLPKSAPAAVNQYSRTLLLVALYDQPGGNPPQSKLKPSYQDDLRLFRGILAFKGMLL
jgi:hypothetical protein